MTGGDVFAWTSVDPVTIVALVAVIVGGSVFFAVVAALSAQSRTERIATLLLSSLPGEHWPSAGPDPRDEVQVRERR